MYLFSLSERLLEEYIKNPNNSESDKFEALLELIYITFRKDGDVQVTESAFMYTAKYYGSDKSWGEWLDIFRKRVFDCRENCMDIEVYFYISMDETYLELEQI